MSSASERHPPLLFPRWLSSGRLAGLASGLLLMATALARPARADGSGEATQGNAAGRAGACGASGVVDGHLGARIPASACAVPPGASVEDLGNESGPRVVVEVDAVTFENGEVPAADAALQRFKRNVARCAGAVGDPAPLTGQALGGQEAPIHRGRRAVSSRLARPRGSEAVARPLDAAGAPVGSDSADTPVPGRAARGGSAPAAAVDSSAGGEVLPASHDEVAQRSSQRAARRLEATNSSVRVTFLVRAPGRAEGVDVAQSRSVSGELLRCVANELSGRVIGTPTTDAVGVSVTFRLRKSGASASRTGPPAPSSEPSQLTQPTRARATRL